MNSKKETFLKCFFVNIVRNKNFGQGGLYCADNKEVIKARSRNRTSY